MSESVFATRRSQLPSLRFTLPVIDLHRTDKPRTPAGIVAGLLMLAAAVLLVVDNAEFRTLEARAVTPLAGLVIRGTATRAHDIVYFGLGTPHRFGLHLTDECTSALLLIPLFVMMGSFAILTRMPLRRQLAALFAGALLILAVNLGRMVGIAYATWEWGFNPGYEYSHVFIGSAFSLVGFVGAVLLALWILVRADRTRLAPAATHGGSTMTTTLQSTDDTHRPRRLRSRRPAPAASAPAASGPATASEPEGSASPDDVAAMQEAAAARAELAVLRDRFENELAHLRHRFDHHLVAAQEGERAALDQATELEAALERAEEHRRALEARSRELEVQGEAAAKRAAEAEARATAAATARPHPGASGGRTARSAGRHAATPSPEDLRRALADVQQRIETLADRVRP